MNAVSPQRILVDHYESCFARHGRTPQGVDWPSEEDLRTRYDVMLGVMRGAERASLLDLGCGPGLLLDYLDQKGRLAGIDYEGIDLSEPMLAAARQKWRAHRFFSQDILADPLPPGSYDYVILNGVLTERRSVPRAEMAAYALDLLEAAFKGARIGIAFNVMSPIVDWERGDLFHWPFDEMMRAVSTRLSRHVAVRADYGLYEYTAYVYRAPMRGGDGA